MRINENKFVFVTWCPFKIQRKISCALFLIQSDCNRRSFLEAFQVPCAVTWRKKWNIWVYGLEIQIKWKHALRFKIIQISENKKGWKSGRDRPTATGFVCMFLAGGNMILINWKARRSLTRKRGNTTQQLVVYVLVDSWVSNHPRFSDMSIWQSPNKEAGRSKQSQILPIAIWVLAIFLTIPRPSKIHFAFKHSKLLLFEWVGTPGAKTITFSLNIKLVEVVEIFISEGRYSRIIPWFPESNSSSFAKWSHAPVLGSIKRTTPCSPKLLLKWFPRCARRYRNNFSNVMHRFEGVENLMKKSVIWNFDICIKSSEAGIVSWKIRRQSRIRFDSKSWWVDH